MKNIQWKNKLHTPSITASHVLTDLKRYEPGRTGYATYKDVDVLLQITKKESNTLFHAVVIGFDPPTATLSDLQVADEVEVGIQHFIPD
jgi:hypothetical protein